MKKMLFVIVMMSYCAAGAGGETVVTPELLLETIQRLESEVGQLRSRVVELESASHAVMEPDAGVAAPSSSGIVPVVMQTAPIRPRTYYKHADIDVPKESLPSRHTFSASSMHRVQKADYNDFSTRNKAFAAALVYTYRKDAWHIGASISGEENRYRYSERPSRSYEPIIHLPSFAKSSSETYGATIYGGFDFPSGWYGKASLFAGRSSTDVENKYVYGNYIGNWPNNIWQSREFEVADDFNNYNIAGSIEFGKVVSLSHGFFIKPHIGIESSYVSDFEWGIDDWWIFEHSDTPTTVLPFGISGTKEFSRGDWTFSPSLDVTLLHTIQPGSGSMASFDGSKWNVYSGGNANHLATRIGLGFKMIYKDRMDFNIEFVGEKNLSGDGSLGADISDFTEGRVSASFGLSF